MTRDRDGDWTAPRSWRAPRQGRVSATEGPLGEADAKWRARKKGPPLPGPFPQLLPPSGPPAAGGRVEPEGQRGQPAGASKPRKPIRKLTAGRRGRSAVRPSKNAAEPCHFCGLPLGDGRRLRYDAEASQFAHVECLDKR